MSKLAGDGLHGPPRIPIASCELDLSSSQPAGSAGSSFWLALFALALASPALAAETSADDPAVWAQDGRPLPEPELLQPRLDDRLPPYRPCPANAIRGKLEGSAPAILPKLVAKWLQAFQALYPNARIAVPPPYLGPQGSLSSPMQKFLDGRSDFAFVSRDLAASDLASCLRRLRSGAIRLRPRDSRGNHPSDEGEGVYERPKSLAHSRPTDGLYRHLGCLIFVACICHMIGWPVFWLRTETVMRSRLRMIWTTKSKLSCAKRQPNVLLEVILEKETVAT
jgi:hypothetical protein